MDNAIRQKSELEYDVSSDLVRYYEVLLGSCLFWDLVDPVYWESYWQRIGLDPRTGK